MTTNEVVKVDRQLFITCRLCLETMGTYQITPGVREQFIYCFDINVEPFDGMPQLICEECQSVLNDSSTKKRIFIGRQNALKAQLQVRKEIALQTQQESVTPSLQNDDKRGDNHNYENEAIKRTERKGSNSRPDSASSTNSRRWSNSPSSIPSPHRSPRPSPGPSPSPNPNPSVTSSKHNKKRKKSKYIPNYSKSVICRFCNKQVKSRSKLKKHLNFKHTKLLSTFSNILKRHCLVKLDKWDGLPNKSGIPDTVMLDHSKIISQDEKTIHYIQYSPNETYTAKEHSDSQSDEEDIGKGKKRKRQRLLSTETIVLQNENNSRPTSAVLDISENKDIECINIDDSSNSGTDESPVNDNTNDTRTDSESKALCNFVNVCYSEYIKKCELLRHEILSFGRKIVSKDSPVISTALLPFLECKNLEIQWIPTSSNRDTDVIHVMSMSKEKDVPQDNEVWKEINKFQHSVPEHNTNTKKTVENDDKSLKFAKNQSLENIASSERETALQNSEPDSKILLNANPVANPKQLPKKTNGLPVNTSTTSLADMLQTESVEPPPPATSSLANLSTNVNIQSVPAANHASAAYLVPLDIVTENLSHSELAGLPVITSTTFLATPLSENGSGSNDVENIQPSQPRIKVRPASQLMSDRALKTLSDHQAQKSNTLALSGIMQNLMQEPTPTVEGNTGFVALANPEGGKIILGTEEFPNTITDSPFRYFRNLLQVHNIILIEPQTSPMSNFVCLIRFKLQLTQSNNSLTVTISLSVHCLENMYILGVEDPRQGDYLDMSTLSALLQWQILESLEDVEKKMLLVALNLGPTICENTKRFLSLLKSINFKLPHELIGR